MLRISRLPRAGNGAAQDGDSDGAMDIQQLTEAMNRFVRSKGWYERGAKANARTSAVPGHTP